MLISTPAPSTNGDDTIRGNRNNETIDAGAGNDLVFGGDGADKIFGQQGVDALDGGSGPDELNGSLDSDYLIGSAGDDWLNGEPGDDVLAGGIGADTFFFYVRPSLGGTAGIDVITDFSLADGDKIHVARSFGATSPNQFTFDDVLNVLNFSTDPNNINGSRVAFATVEPQPGLTPGAILANIVIV